MIQFLDKIGVTVISLNFGLGGKMHDEEVHGWSYKIEDIISFKVVKSSNVC